MVADALPAAAIPEILPCTSLGAFALAQDAQGDRFGGAGFRLHSDQIGYVEHT